MQTSPPSGGQQRPPTDPGVAPVPVAAPAPAQPPSTGGNTIPIAAPVAQPQLGSGSQPIAQPDTAPIQVQPVPIEDPTRINSGARSVFQTTLAPITSTTILRSTATDGSVVSITSPVVITPAPNAEGDGHSDSSDHVGGESHSPGDSHSSKSTTMRVQPGAVIGAVFGVISFLAIVGLLFFCFRRRRGNKRNSGTPLIVKDNASSTKSAFSARFGTFLAAPRPSGEGFSNTKVAMSEKVHAVFATRSADKRPAGTKNAIFAKFGGLFAQRRASASQENLNLPRLPTPNLERGMHDSSSSVYSNAARTRASSVPVMAFRSRAMSFFKPRSRSRPRFGHKREASDVSFVGDKHMLPALPPRLPSPVAQHRRSTSSVADFIQSWAATDELLNDPFRDPETNQPLTMRNSGLSRSNTQRSAAKLSPILQSKPYQQSPPLPSKSFGPSIATSAVAAAAMATRQSPKMPGHARSFSQVRTPNPFADPVSITRSMSPTSSVYTADPFGRSNLQTHSRGHTVSMGRSLQHQPSKSSVDSGFESAKSPIVQQRKDDFARPDSDALKQWHLSEVLTSRDGHQSTRSTTPTHDPFRDDLRMSDFQFFDNSPASDSSRYPSYVMDRQSRVSDPFDLDRPEVLAGMKPTWSQTMAGRAGSRRDSPTSRGTPITPDSTRNEKQTSGFFLPSDVYLPR